MRELSDRENQRDIIVSQCLECLAEKGLDLVSTRDFSDATGMTASSLYYWFKNKDEIVVEAVKYGLKITVSKLLEYASSNILDITNNYEKFFVFLSKHKKTLRVVFQASCSPQYRNRINEYVNDISSLYCAATEKISKNINVSFEQLRPVVDLYVSTVVDYVLWDDEEKFKREMLVIPWIVSKLEHNNCVK